MLTLSEAAMAGPPIKRYRAAAPTEAQRTPMCIAAPTPRARQYQRSKNYGGFRHPGAKREDRPDDEQVTDEKAAIERPIPLAMSHGKARGGPAGNLTADGPLSKRSRTREKQCDNQRDDGVHRSRTDGRLHRREPPMAAEGEIEHGHKKTNRRAHSGRKSKQTAAPTSLGKGCGAPTSRKLPRPPACSEGDSSCTVAVVPKRGRKAAAAPQEAAPSPLTTARGSRAPARAASTAGEAAPKRARLMLHVHVPPLGSIERDASPQEPQPRLAGRGWHERWPPPHDAKRRRVAPSAQIRFARY